MPRLDNTMRRRDSTKQKRDDMITRLDNTMMQRREKAMQRRDYTMPGRDNTMQRQEKDNEICIVTWRIRIALLRHRIVLSYPRPFVLMGGRYRKHVIASCYRRFSLSLWGKKLNTQTAKVQYLQSDCMGQRNDCLCSDKKNTRCFVKTVMVCSCPFQANLEPHLLQ